MEAISTDASLRVAGGQEPPSIDWRGQWALLRRRSSLLTVVTLTILALGVAAVFLIPGRYAATADVMIDPRRERVVELQQVLPDLPTDGAALDTEVEVLKSRALAEKVVERLNLDRDPEFDGALRPSLFGRRAAAPSASPEALSRRHEAAVTRVAARLKVKRLGFTYVIALSFTSASADKAAAIANAFTAAYLQQQLDAKSAAARRASDWLSARLGGLRVQVEAAERAVERYKADHGLMTLSDAQGATVTEQELSTLDGQQAVARAERAEAQARLEAAQAQLSGGGQGDDLGEVLNSPVVQELRKERDRTAKEIAELEGRYGPRHPDLMKAERQRVEIDGQIKQEIGRVVSNLKVQADVARSREAAVDAAVAVAKAALVENNGASVGLKELERNLEAVRTLYQSFLDRFKQTSAQDGMAQSDARLVSSAKAPAAPTSPNRPILLALVLATAVVAGLLSAWFVEAWEDGLHSADDLKRRLGLDCLALIPRVRAPARGSGAAPFSPIDWIEDQPFSSFTESFRVLRAALHLNGSPNCVFVVTSAYPGDGKTTTALALGRSLARSGRGEVLVVDCDLRRRTINHLLAEAPRLGLIDLLAGAVELDETLVRDADGMAVLPLGEQSLSNDDLLSEAAMDRLLDTLRQRFRTTILDTAPVHMAPETRALAAKVDGVLFVARWRRTPAEAAATAVKLLEAAGARIVGALLTQADLRHAGPRAYGYANGYDPFYRREEAVQRRAFATPRRSRNPGSEA
jgi:capsular exopolysaccharide synthesis family protein